MTVTYPVKPSEHGSYQWLRREVGGHLGFGFDVATWTHDQEGKVESIVQSGVMQFYYPPPLPAGDEAPPPHQWSFMAPVAALSTVAETAAYDLPETFSGVLSDFTFTSGDDVTRIPVIPEVRLRQLRSDGTSGTPRYAAVRPKVSDGGAEQRHEVLFYPTPDTAYSLEYRHSVAPVPLSEANPWPLGGRRHAETILQSCLALADERETKGAGISTERWMSRLAASVQLDMQSLRPTEEDAWSSEDNLDTLELTHDQLRRLVGRHMGHGPHEKAWTHTQAREIDHAVRQGLRRFYLPPILPGERHNHEWSFLKPVSSLGLIGDQWEYDLPDDFARLEGPVVYAPDSNVFHQAIRFVPEHKIRMLRQDSIYTGRPLMCAVRPKQLDENTGTRYEMLFWPVPDQAYEVRIKYARNPGMLLSDRAFPFGGQPHTETVLQSCLAAADEARGRETMHRARFMECLAASVSHDKNVSAPDFIGYNADRSDKPMDGYWDWHDADEGRVPYNGVYY